MITSPRRWWWRTTVAVIALGFLSWSPLRSWQLAGLSGGQAAIPAGFPCPQGQSIEILPSPHISWDEASTASYNSVPPTSGPHFPFSLATGIYTDPIPDGLTVHALEHGHIAIHYPLDAPKQTVAALREVAKRHSDQVVLAPYAGIIKGIALTAWGCLLLLEKPDERVEEFVVALAGRYRHGWKADA